MVVNGSGEKFELGYAEGDTIRPSPENYARLQAARVVPHPMGDWDPYADGRKSAPVVAPPEGWPEPMQGLAFHGLAGEFVRLVLPETEADPAALLMAFLVGVGCMIGRRPHYQVESTRHGVNLFSVIVGDTSKARKGTATDRAVDILSRMDSEFMAQRLRSGLSSGEGLIQAVRDPREEDVANKAKDGSLLRFERQMVDNGEPDKRLFVVESEFGSVLQQTGREGNILSAILRDCWDGRPLRILARTNKDACKEPHISLLGNVTAEELKRLLTTNDRANGFGNRILWCCARRSKLLPYGGRKLDQEQLNMLAQRLRAAVVSARQIDCVRFDEQARHAWKDLYAVLSQGAAGLFGSMTARAEAQVVRLASLYALLDASSLIRLDHLSAAYEVWGYCEESVRYIFGDVLGDETADAILKLLQGREDGMTQTEMNRAFSGHKASSELKRALALLEGKGKVKAEREATGGGALTRWTLASERHE